MSSLPRSRLWGLSEEPQHQAAINKIKAEHDGGVARSLAAQVKLRRETKVYTGSERQETARLAALPRRHVCGPRGWLEPTAQQRSQSSVNSSPSFASARTARDAYGCGRLRGITTSCLRLKRPGTYQAYARIAHSTVAHPRAAVEAAAKSGRLEIPELRRFPSLGLFLFTPLARSVAGTISAPIRIARTTAARPPSVIADCGDFEHPGSPGRGARLWT